MLPDFRLETYFSKWEFTARYNLAASDLETLALEELLSLGSDDDRARWASLRLGYTQTFGLPALREAIAGTYERVDADDVICFAGAQEGIFCAMHALLAAGDHAVVLVPNYQSLEEIPRSICEVTGVALREGEGWSLDLDELRDAIRSNTKLITINFPNNPTGAVIDDETFAAVVDLARESGAYLLSDEVYRGLERPLARQLPNGADVYEKALSLGVMSKAYGLAGLRLGWIASRDRGVLSRMERVKHYLSITNAAPSEVLATIALRARETILARNRAIVAENLGHVTRFFGDHGDLFEWYATHAGCVAFPRYLGDDGVEEFCRSAVEEAGVLLLPASVFRSELRAVAVDRFRIGFGRRDCAEALAVLDAHVTAGRMAGSDR